MLTPLGVALGVRKAEVGSIEVRVRSDAPVKAAVLLDKVHRGSAPLRLDRVPSGRHNVEVRASGYLPSSREVQVSTNITLRLEIELVPDQSKKCCVSRASRSRAPRCCSLRPSRRAGARQRARARAGKRARACPARHHSRRAASRASAIGSRTQPTPPAARSRRACRSRSTSSATSRAPLITKSLEVNFQSVRWPSTIRPQMAGHAEYGLLAFDRLSAPPYLERARPHRGWSRIACSSQP